MPNWSIRLFFLFVVLLEGLTLAAQRPHLKHYGVGDGLASSTVYGAYQDRHGYMWFATESGVNRFDGTEFETFTTADGLPSNTAFSFAEDNTGRLWVSCNNSRPAYFDGRRWVVDTVLIKPDETAGVRRNLNFHRHGDSLYFNFGNQIFLLHNDTVEKFPITLDFAFTHLGGSKKIKPKSSEMLTLEIQVTSENILLLHASFSSYVYNQDTSRLILGKEGYSLNIRQRGNFFYRSVGDKISSFRIDGKKTSRLMSLNAKYEVVNFIITSSGDLWLEEKKIGLTQYKLDEFNEYQPVLRLTRVNGLADAFVDKENNTWITTLTQGLIKIGSNQISIFEQKNDINSNSFFSLDTIRNNFLACANSIGEVFIFKNNWEFNVTKKYALNSKRILNITFDSKSNKVWLGTDTGPFAISTDDKIEHFNIAPVKSIHINSDDFLIGYWAAIEHFKRGSKPISNVDISSSIKAYALLKKSENLFVGTMNGLQVWSSTDTIFLNRKYPELLSTRITALQPDKAGNVWVGTHTNGVVILDMDNVVIKNIQDTDGLTSNQVQNLRYDGRGFFWACTNKGLTKIDEHTFKVVATYDDQTTLPNKDVNDCLPFGDTIWVATADGLARFQDRVNKTPDNFRTILKSLSTLDSVYKATDEPILIPQYQNDLKLTFAGLTFRSNGKLTYEYQLNRLLPPLWQWTLEDVKTGILRFWGNTTTELTGKVTTNQLNINNLSSGKYLFTVTAISYDGVMSRHPANLTFQILPIWTDLFLFYVALISSMIYALYRIYNWRQNLLRNELQLKEQLGSLQFEAFKTRINPHFVFNSINGVQQFFFPPEPEKANTYISLLSTLLRKTMYMSDVNFVALKDELLYISDFLAMAKLRLGRAMEYRIDLAENLDDKIEIPAMILQPLLENAIIHGTKDGLTKVHLNISLTDQVLSCIVEDHGHGILKKTKQLSTVTQHESKGLALIRQRIDALNSVFKTRIELEILDKSSVSHQNQTGTRVTLKIDLKHARKEK